MPLTMARRNPVHVDSRALGIHAQHRRVARGGKELVSKRAARTHLVSPNGTALCSSGEGKLSASKATVLTCGRCIQILAMQRAVGRVGGPERYAPGRKPSEGSRAAKSRARRFARGTSFAIPGGAAAWRSETAATDKTLKAYRMSRYGEFAENSAALAVPKARANPLPKRSARTGRFLKKK